MKRNSKTCKVGGNSKLRNLPVEEIALTVLESYSYSEVIRKIGLDVKTVYINTLREIIGFNGISTVHFSRNKIGKNNAVESIYDNSRFLEGLKESSKISQSTIKRGLKFHNLLEYKCSECPIVDEYNGKPITLQLDHINGINNDNRIENLRWICPNCHSQSDTFAGRNARKHIIRYCTCGTKLHVRNKTGKCSSCIDWIAIANSYDRVRKFNPTKDELVALVKEKPMTEIGKMFGVSDNAVKKRCKKLGIELKPMRGYWRKVETGNV